MAPARKLPDAVKIRIVTGLASFETPSAIVEAIRDEFGIEVSRQLVSTYDPGTAAGKRLSERWQRLFAEAREAFLKDAAAVGIFHQIVRLRRLEALFLKAEAGGNVALAATVLEQAAKEVGGAFTNFRTLRATVDDKRPVPKITPGMSEKELAQLWEEAIREGHLAEGLN